MKKQYDYPDEFGSDIFTSGFGGMTGGSGIVTIPLPNDDLFSPKDPEIYVRPTDNNKPPVIIPNDDILPQKSNTTQPFQSFFNKNDETIHWIIAGAIIYFLFLR